MKKLWLLGYDVVEIAGGYRHASFQGSEVQFSQTHIHTETCCILPVWIYILQQQKRNFWLHAIGFDVTFWFHVRFCVSVVKVCSCYSCCTVYYIRCTNCWKYHNITGWLQLSETCFQIDRRVSAKMEELVRNGVRRLPQMRSEIGRFVTEDMFQNRPPPVDTDSRYWPSSRQMLSCIYRVQKHMR